LKKISKFLVICGIVLFNLFSAAVQAEDYRIGAVNAVRILEQSPQAEKLRSQIEKEFSPRDRELVAAQKKLKEMEDRLERDSAIMSETERKDLEREIINMRRDIKRDQDEFREDLSFRRNEELTKIQKEIVQAIQTVAKQNNYDIVLSEGVIFASTKVDITDLVIDYLRKKNGSQTE
jgi:outer membrane protein